MSRQPYQGSAAWLAERRNGVGASDIPVILGISEYKTRLELYLEKRGEIEPARSGAAAQRGHLLEDAVARWYEAETGRKVARVHKPVHHPEYPWAFASLDRRTVAAPRIPVEIKTSARRHGNGLPEGTLAQVTWQCFCAEAAEADVATLGGDLAFHLDHVVYDPELGGLLFAEAESFWADVVAGREPEPGPLDGPALARRWPRAEVPEIPASPEFDDLAARLRDARHIAAEAQALADTTANAIKSLMGPAGLVTGAGYRLRWGHSERRTTAWKSVAEAAAVPAELVDAHTRVETVRTFRPWFEGERADE